MTHFIFVKSKTKLLINFFSSQSILNDMKQYPNSGFCWFAVCLVVWTPLFPLTPGCVGISQVVQKNKNKKQTTNRGWKEEIDKHRFRTAKLRKVKLALSSIRCLFMAIVRTENLTQQQKC